MLGCSQCLNNCPEMTMTKMRTQFQQILILCGIPEDRHEFLMNQGILSTAEFIKLSLDNGIKDLKRLAMTVHIAPEASFPPDPNGPAAVATAAAATATAMRNRGVDIPYMAWLNLHAELMYTVSL